MVNVKDKNEREFWEGINNRASPGWEVKLADHMAPGGLNLADYDIFVYVVDTSSGWIAGGTTRSQDVKNVHQAITTSGIDQKQVKDAAAEFVTQHGKDFPLPGSPETKKCINAAISAMTLTSTYQKVLPNGLHGHWLYVAYKMADGTELGRPVFFRHPGIGFAPPGDVNHIIKQVILQDVGNPATSVYKMIQACGGAILSVELGGNPSGAPTPSSSQRSDL